jgi:hypothetical protein
MMTEEETRRINNLTRRVFDLEQKTSGHPDRPPPQQTSSKHDQISSYYHKRPWLGFESSVLDDDVEQLISKRMVQFGRSRNSMIWKMWHLISQKRDLPQEP